MKKSLIFLMVLAVILDSRRKASARMSKKSFDEKLPMKNESIVDGEYLPGTFDSLSLSERGEHS